VSAPRLSAGSAADVAAVMTVMQAAFDPRYGEAWRANQCLSLLALPGTILWLAHDGGPIGFALARIIAGECELMMLGVDPGWQRRGVGGQLLNIITEIARARGAEAMFLEMRAGNPAAALYAAAQFIKVGSRPHYYRGLNGEAFDAETYRCDLN
jgi:[ribosomal protein S18]-alanine N-acetyltransferase